MKKLVLVMIVALVMMVGCESINENNDGAMSNIELVGGKVEDAGSSSSVSTGLEQTDGGGVTTPPDDRSIAVRSLEELEEMRQMIKCTDEKILEEYLLSVEGGAATVDDLIEFTELVDTIPYIRIKAGTISWIAYSEGVSEETKKGYEILHISTVINENEWYRIEYRLNETDASNIASSGSYLFLDTPVKNKDGTVEILAQREKGNEYYDMNIVRWIATIEGNLAVIVYKSPDVDNYDFVDLFSETGVTTFENVSN